MSSDKVNLQQVLDAVEQLREEVRRLDQRIVNLEASVSLPASSQPPASHESDSLNEELVLTISAAIAAYLGVKPHIRQIRLLGGATWGESGRATIQASHAARPLNG